MYHRTLHVTRNYVKICNLFRRINYESKSLRHVKAERA